MIHERVKAKNSAIFQFSMHQKLIMFFYAALYVSISKNIKNEN